MLASVLRGLLTGASPLTQYFRCFFQFMTQEPSETSYGVPVRRLGSCRDVSFKASVRPAGPASEVFSYKDSEGNEWKPDD